MATKHQPSKIESPALTDAQAPHTPDFKLRPKPRTDRTPPSLNTPEAYAFLQDLTNYLPIGSLVHKRASGQAQDDDDLEWRECANPIDVLGHDHPLVQGLRRLLIHGWIRLFLMKTTSAIIIRIYVLPGDVGRRFVDHQNRQLSAALYDLISTLDISPETWQGRYDAQNAMNFDPWAEVDEGSLYFMFNKIPSPSPSSEKVSSHFHRKALDALLDPERQLSGLQARLYPFQRRSAGLMLQRESESRLVVDPRLEARTAPDGRTYYYGPRDTVFLHHAPYYESCRGGILAETMGNGKTVICIALMLATKGLLPATPVQYDQTVKRDKVGSLSDMAVSSINRHRAPWKPFFVSHEASTGEQMINCINMLRKSPPQYEIPAEPIRWNRNTSVPPPKKMILAPTTIVVVPRNLFSQWQTELAKHTEKDSLSVLLMDDTKKPLPQATDLISYDVVLFSRSRFEQEARDGSDRHGRRASRYPQSCKCPYIGATRKRDCVCLREEDIYDSPLKYIHFLRIIIDEGHFFSSSNTTAARVAEKLVVADHRWVVSGTPAKDLLGVEMDLLAAEGASSEYSANLREDALIDRMNFDPKHDIPKNDKTGAIKSLGSLAGSFLRIRPWCATGGELAANWENYIYRHEGRGTTFSGFSKCLRQTLESCVIRTRPEDVEVDIELPPLSHSVVRLKPSLNDKLTANTFTFVLTANAVTSERTDADYLFHPNSQKARNQLVGNLRQSAFFWTGFSEADVAAAINHSEAYLRKEDARCSPADRTMLERCVTEAKRMLGSNEWKALSRSHEIGLFLENWPNESASFWAFDDDQPMLCGATQLLDAQGHVNKQAGSLDPAEGLPGVGLRALTVIRPAVASATEKGSETPLLMKSGVPSSSVNGLPTLHRRPSSSAKGQKHPPSPETKRKAGQSPTPHARKRPKLDPDVKADNKDHVPAPADEPVDLPMSSPLRQTMMIGTTSAKFSYLLSRIASLYRDEKIIVFYEGDNTAYYLAQALELLHISHLIYAKSLSPHQKSEYIVRFDQGSTFRVLIMDVNQAAFGLNLTSASRVFFVNPVCRPHVEAQAIKRAHRIGQTRKVFVETLILEDSLEEKMFERSKRMTKEEHREAAKALDEDGGIKAIIQGARLLPINEDQWHGHGKVASLDKPEQLWSRPGWATWASWQTDGQRARNREMGVAGASEQSDSTDSADQAAAESSINGRRVMIVEPDADSIASSPETPLLHRDVRKVSEVVSGGASQRYVSIFGT